MVSLVSIVTVSFSTPVTAQRIVTIPPGSYNKQAQPPPLSRSTSQPAFTIDRKSASPEGDEIDFVIEGVTLDGVTALSPEEIVSLTAPFEQRRVTLRELSRLVDKISALYVSKGFALTVALLPVQTTENGRVRILVVEGTIDQIDVEFKDRLSIARATRIASTVRKRLRAVAQAGPVRTYELERSILGIDDLNGITPSIIVRPSKTVEGAADLVVVIDTKGFELNLSGDDRLRKEFGRNQMGLSIAANGLVFVGDRLDISHRISRVDGAYDYRSLSYSAPVGSSLIVASILASQSKTEAVSGFLSALEYRGLERTGRFSLEVPLYRSRAKSLALNFDLAALDSSSDLFGATLIKDRVRTFNAGMTYDWAGRLGASSLLELSYVKGLEGLEATDADNPLRSRSYGSAEAAYLTARLYRDQPIGSFNLKLDLSGQVVTRGQSLWASAECSFGGSVYGRGFDYGLIGGDSCLLASLELSKRLQGSRFNIAPYVFVDGGRIGQNGPLEFGEVREAIATSAGLGLRMITRGGLSLDVQYARPQENPAPAMPRDGRWFLSLGYTR
ncbi:MAG: hypothetical protein RLZZ141_547 [Pseudomonadota bacterium]